MLTVGTLSMQPWSQHYLQQVKVETTQGSTGRWIDKRNVIQWDDGTFSLFFKKRKRREGMMGGETKFRRPRQEVHWLWGQYGLHGHSQTSSKRGRKAGWLIHMKKPWRQTLLKEQNQSPAGNPNLLYLAEVPRAAGLTDADFQGVVGLRANRRSSAEGTEINWRRRRRRRRLL